MTFTTSKSKIRTIRPHDKDWLLRDGLVVAGRGGVEISLLCPYEYKAVLHKAIQNGWIKPIANVYDHEIMWDELTEK